MSKQDLEQYPAFLNLQEDGSGTQCYQCCISCCGFFWGCCAAWVPCFRCCVDNPYTSVKQGYQGVIERYGKFQQIVEPGLHYINPCTEKIIQLNTKTQIIDLSKQACITKDNISISLDAAVYFKIMNTYNANYRIINLKDAVNFLTFSSLRNVAGQLTLQEFLEKRGQVAQQIQDQVSATALEWGVTILYGYLQQTQLQLFLVLIKDVLISQDVQLALSSVAKETRFATSKVISANADVKAAELMKESSEILNTNSAMQIRFLDTLLQLTKSAGTKLILLPQE